MTTLTVRTTPGKKVFLFYLQMSQLCKSVQYDCWSKNLLRLNINGSVQFQTKIQQIAAIAVRSPKYLELGYFQMTGKKRIKMENARA